MEYLKDYFDDKEVPCLRDSVKDGDTWYIEVFPYESYFQHKRDAEKIRRIQGKWFIPTDTFNRLRESVTSIESFNGLLLGQLEVYKEFMDKLNRKIDAYRRVKEIVHEQPVSE